MEIIPENYVNQVVRYLKVHSVFLLGRFSYEDVYFQVKLFKITPVIESERTPVFFIRVSYEKLCENVIQFTCRPGTIEDKKEELTQIKELLKRFNDWRKFIQQKKVHFFNEDFESMEMYKTKLFMTEWTSGESNDVCYVCHEPCLYYENRNCSHPIHKLCLVKMLQRNQNRCGICKKSLDDDDDE
jgi:hypothetical protein